MIATTFDIAMFLSRAETPVRGTHGYDEEYFEKINPTPKVYLLLLLI